MKIENEIKILKNRIEILKVRQGDLFEELERRIIKLERSND